MSYSFTSEEWEVCLKVLESLQGNPLENPDNQRFKTLITKIHKTAKKQIRHNAEPLVSNGSTGGFKREKQLKQEADKATVRSSRIVHNALNIVSEYGHDDSHEPTFSHLNYSKQCYSCKASFKEMHSFYHRLCPDCARLNYANRSLSYDLTGYQAILTGGRIKIGYATVLKLLRSGARVLVTTRFPALALEQYRQEKDFREWEDRLELYGLDLRNLQSVYGFIEYCKNELNQVDILINNAAQTIKYTPQYYEPLVGQEKKLLREFGNVLQPNETPLVANQQMLLETSEESFLPLNRFGQPVDHRDKNSWNSTLHEVGIEELLEVNLINHISPYILISGLKDLMKHSPNSERFIVNVTSSEGQFSYANKTIHHPHTNMTKAALNMLTRTSAAEFVEDQIYMNAVDVGWVSTGAHEAKRHELFENNHVPPLDSVDGAMRIFKSMVDVLQGDKNQYGKLLKDYRVVDW